MSKALERHLKPLLPFLETDGVTEISINNPQEVYVEKNSVFTRHIVKELEIEFLMALASLIAEYNNKVFPHPLLSGSLPGGERVQFVISPACESNVIICSIRRHQMRDMALDDYSIMGAFDEIASSAGNPNQMINEELKNIYHKRDILEFIKHAVKAKKNIIISGGTGTGKTTFLNSCLKLIPEKERLITVEDTREVVVRQPNTVNLLFNEDDENITALKIFKVCLRLRPDRIFLSELRGSEAWPFCSSQ